MSVSEQKLAVAVEDVDFAGTGKTKKWVKVTLLGGRRGFYPSFEDLFRIIQPICDCEDDKYPSGEGRRMVARFLVDCCRPGAVFANLREKYRVPVRKPDEKWQKPRLQLALHSVVLNDSGRCMRCGGFHGPDGQCHA